MRREAIEMSYFARCSFCSEIIIAERIRPTADGRSSHGAADLRKRPTNDNYLGAVIEFSRPRGRASGVQPAA
jgi:hypothetical protein